MFVLIRFFSIAAFAFALASVMGLFFKELDAAQTMALISIAFSALTISKGNQ